MKIQTETELYLIDQAGAKLIYILKPPTENKIPDNSDLLITSVLISGNNIEIKLLPIWVKKYNNHFTAKYRVNKIPINLLRDINFIIYPVFANLLNI